MQTINSRITDIESHLDKTPDTSHDIWYVQQKMTDIEDRSRRNNLKIIGHLEQIEKDDMLGFVTNLIPTLINITVTVPLEFQRAHCISSRTSDRSTNPRHTLACCLRHQQARQIITVARKHGPYAYDKEKKQVIITADFSAPTNLKKKQFLHLRSRLKKRDIKYGLLEPPTVIVTFQGKTKENFDLHNLESFLNDLDNKDSEMEQKSSSPPRIKEPSTSTTPDDADQEE
ncbi:hypothetical protein NDU88_006987 [Pleurodeles waltl]|uniref:Uncharacterized protein n=1 Tax=Pleurodeles waltl TaxID=8319 RepID=A0AAV7TYS4_PLEWA|nr:hypothetical protein NDU88_006987 [Pleurodeles waltl]